MITSKMMSSGISFASPSTIKIASFVPATTIFNVVTSNCASVGLTTILPSTRPMRTPAIGPAQGISEMDNAAEAPINAQISGAWS